MIFKISQLKKAMDEARIDPALSPHNGMTFCNLNAFRVAQDLGFNHFWNDEKDRPMIANECVDYMEKSPDKFSKIFNPFIAYDMANNGHLVFAAHKEIPHGHIAPIYPKQELVTSGKWHMQVPLVSNVGKENKVMGLNFAFAELPNFYLCI